jgi:hypothetical protein
VTTIASIVRDGLKSRVVLRRDGRRALERAAAVLRDLRAAGGEAICEHVAGYLERIKERHAPPAKVQSIKRSSKDQQLPKGDRT